MAGLVVPVNAPASQPFAGAFSGELPGWFVNGTDGRPLKAYFAEFPGGIKHHDFHRGIDLYGALGTRLKAIQNGTVTFAKADASTLWSKTVRVTIQGHPNVRYSFGHCDSFLVKVGDKVTRGQAIATMGKTGKAFGVHDHFMIEIYEKGADGRWRWMAYDPARFYPNGTFKMGKPYGGKPIHGGSHLYDDRIFPIRAITINDGVNVRPLPSTSSNPYFQTSGVLPSTQVNEVPGGHYTVGGVDGNMWAKVRVTVSGKVVTAYVAKPLIKVT